MPVGSMHSFKADHNGINWKVVVQGDADGWPEYYDGRRGRLVGRRASLNQVWSSTSFILAHKRLEGGVTTSRIFR